MKLYVCWGTFPTPRPGGHPCANAYQALRDAGHDPEVVKSYGLVVLPDTPFNQTAGRKRAKELTGSSMVPFLELDDGTAIAGSKEIAAWAAEHPAVLAGATA
jgi:Glutathione S-transferase, N-terminal domain